MKTRDRILVCSLELFNTEGEAHCTTIDIANELDISPGNLYYHFKGKDDIIAELYEQFELALSDTLRAAIDQPLGGDGDAVETYWSYLYVVLEEIYQYRFFYHNLDDLLQRYPGIRRRFQRLVDLKRKSLAAVCRALLQDATAQISIDQNDTLLDSLTLTLTFWLSWQQLRGKPQTVEPLVHGGVLALMTIIAPYLGHEQLHFYRDCQQLHARILAAGE